MGKFKQMQIEIDDEYAANIQNEGEDAEEPVENTEANFDSLCEELEKEFVKKPKCSHKVKIASFKRELATYCIQCGKILSIRRKK